MPKFASGSMSRMSVMETLNSGATAASMSNVISTETRGGHIAADNPGAAAAMGNRNFA